MSLFLCMVLGSVLISFFYMELSSFPSTTYWRGCLFSTVYTYQAAFYRNPYWDGLLSSLLVNVSGLTLSLMYYARLTPLTLTEAGWELVIVLFISPVPSTVSGPQWMLRQRFVGLNHCILRNEWCQDIAGELWSYSWPRVSIPFSHRPHPDTLMHHLPFLIHSKALYWPVAVVT